MEPIITLSRIKQLSRRFRNGSLALAALVAAGTASAQNTPVDSITISGRIYNDADGILSPTGVIDGPSISSVNNQPLYIYLINNSAYVVGKVQVADNGTFSIRAAADTSYNVSLSSVNQNTGIRYPTLGLPVNFAPTAEGDSPRGDNTPDFSVSISSAVNKYLEYGIDARPIGNNYTQSYFPRDVNGRTHIPHIAFTGYDDEDGIYADGMIGRSLDLFEASGGVLYYNGNVISFTSASQATRLASFDTSKLRVQLLPWLPHTFKYSLVDNAGIPELVANDVSLAVVLPVDMTSFTGRRENGINILEWTTASERVNNGFILERSVDGNVFQPVAEIKSKALYGSSNTPNDYSYQDKITVSDARMYFYRIRQVDMDGTVTYSKTVRLTAGNNGTNNGGGNSAPLSTYPNPSTGTLNIDWNTGAAKYTVAIRNSAGTIVMLREIAGNDGNLRTGLDLSNLPSGNYFVTLRGDNQQQTRQITLMTR